MLFIAAEFDPEEPASGRDRFAVSFRIADKPDILNASVFPGSYPNVFLINVTT